MLKESKMFDFNKVKVIGVTQPVVDFIPDRNVAEVFKFIQTSVTCWC